MDHSINQTQASEPEVQSAFTRHRFEPKRRNLTITSKEFVTPKMIRITATGDDLADFVSPAPDDHIRMLVDTGAEKPEMRDYTPRFHSREQNLLVVDFAVHDAGPITQWAIDAAIGDTMHIAGPRGSSELTEAFDWLMLIGDETALPAMGRWVEESPAVKTLITLGIVTSKSEEQVWASQTEHRSYWAHRPSLDDTSAVAALEILKNIDRPAGKGFIWIAAEASVTKALKEFVLDTWQHPVNHLKASGYWIKGVSDSD